MAQISDSFHMRPTHKYLYHSLSLVGFHNGVDLVDEEETSDEPNESCKEEEIDSHNSSVTVEDN